MTCPLFPGGISERLRSSDAFEREVERHREAIYGAALRLTRSRDDAEDLAQEAIARAFAAYDRLETTNFRAWVLRIVSNTYINDYHARRRRPTSALEDDALEAMRDEGATIGASRLIADELDDEILTALTSIPTIFARPVLMIDVVGVSYDEFALAEGIPIGTVRSRLHRGRAQLRVLLVRYAEAEGYLR